MSSTLNEPVNTKPLELENAQSQIQSTSAHPGTMTSQLETSNLSISSPLPEPIITTPRLAIRPMHPSDVHYMQLHASPPSITKYMSLSFAYPYTLQHAENWVKLNLTEKLSNYIITEIDHPEIGIGGIGLKPGSDVESHVAEIGYWIGEPFAGKGYATESVQALTDWVFLGEGKDGKGESVEKWKKLTATVFEGNDASMRVLEKSGYEREGVLKGHIEKHGVVMDLHLFGLRKETWKKRRGIAQASILL